MAERYAVVVVVVVVVLVVGVCALVRSAVRALGEGHHPDVVPVDADVVVAAVEGRGLKKDLARTGGS